MWRGMGVEEWLARGRREMKPLLLKVGVAVSLSVAGYLYSHLRSRADRGDRRLYHLPSHTASEVEGGRDPCGGLKDEILYLQCDDARANVTHGATAIMVSAAMADLSPSSCMNSGDEEERLMSEFNALVLQEFESVGLDVISLETPPFKRSSDKNGEGVAEHEIVLLRSLVQSLQERERSLEIQLLEYYGLKEQESAAMELENRLKISAMESEFLSLKIESLQAENRRLEAQVSDHLETKADLEKARAKIKHLKRKVKSESVQANEKITVLQHRIEGLQDLDRQWEEEAQEAQRRLRKLKDLEDEAVELRRANSKLAMENLDLAKKLESTQSLASSGLPSPEAAEALAESNSLRQKNEELTEQLERLQIDHCTDVEELVYLRWVNACLRYELRNYQPPPGKTLARDLSRTLSPRSEHKVKKLIYEYANSGAVDEMKTIKMMDFDSETCSSSQASSGDVEDVSTDASTPTKNGGSSGKKKFFTKLKRLVLGKDTKDNRFNSSVDGSPSSCGNSGRRASVSACSFDEMVDRSSCDSAASCTGLDHAQPNALVPAGAKPDEQRQNESPWTRDLSRVSLSFQRLRIHEEVGERGKSDTDASRHTGTASCEETPLRSPHSAKSGKEAVGDPGKSELGKHARPARNLPGKPKLHVRSASFSFR